jgi:hypothetical protein
LNLIVTAFICLVYILWYFNIANLFFLFYIIFISFSWVYLYWKDELISINLPNYLLPNVLIKTLKDFSKYLFNYFKWSFKEFKVIEAEESKKQAKLKTEEEAELNKLPPLKLSKFLIYIPIVNLILLFQKENNYKYHVRNWITLSFILILFLILTFFDVISTRWIILFFFPICFGTWMLEEKYYKMPFVYELYEVFAKLKNLFNSWRKKIDEKRKELKEVNLKVKE